MRDAEAVDLRDRTKAYAVRVVRLFDALPRTEVARVLGRQVLRSGTSVGANWREAHRSRSDAEFVAKVGDCIKELDETAYWLELLIESEVVTADRLVELRDETDQLLAILITIVKKVRERSQ